METYKRYKQAVKNLFNFKALYIGVFVLVFLSGLLSIILVDMRNGVLDISADLGNAAILAAAITILSVLLYKSIKSSQALSESSRLLFDNIRDIVLFIGEDGLIIDANKAAEMAYGYSKNELAGMHISTLSKSVDNQVSPSSIKQAVKKGILFEAVHKHKNGSLFPVEVNAKSGIIDGRSIAVNIIRDITERKSTEKALEEHNKRTSSILENMPEPFFTLDRNFSLTYMNPEAEKNMRLEGNNAIGKNYWELFPDLVGTNEYIAALKAMNEKTYLYMEFYYEPFSKWFEVHVYPLDGELAVYFRDITERKETEEQIKYYAYHDYVTGLPNRRKLDEYLQDVLEKAKNEGKIAAVYFADLDEFKKVNDILGHAAGDRLIADTGRRLAESIGDRGMAGRVGGDEFIIVHSDIKSYDEIYGFARKLINIFKEPCIIEGHKFYSTISLGIAVYPKDGSDTSTLKKNADTAMFAAKEKGKNRYIAYNPQMSRKILNETALENRLHSALEHEEFEVYYQPLIDIDTGRIVGAEALLRWISPEGKVISPDNFIPIAERSRLIIPIGEWVLRTVCRQNRIWQDKGYPPICVTVNISPCQFQEADILTLASTCLSESRLAPCWLGLEITENFIVNDIESNLSTLKGLRDMCISIYIDDFGTGYSSLNYLKDLPIDIIKIDRSFIKDITIEEKNQAIANAIITLAHALGLKVVAEGVETPEEHRLLHALGCNTAQGYLYGKPADAKEFERFFQLS